MSTVSTDDLRSLLTRIITSELMNDPLVFSKPAMEKIVIQKSIKIAQIELLEVLPQPSLDTYERVALEALYAVCENERSVMPRRSYVTTWAPMDQSVDTAAMEAQLRALRDVVQPEQRTPEWYAMRNGLITASAASKVLFSDASAFALLTEKVDVAITGSPVASRSMNDASPLEWGKKYEPVSVMYYERVYDTVVQEYGCLIHRNPEYYFLGASPDGINAKLGSPLFGRMLEIKNVFTRVINGIPKEEYWIQMQMQMEVCDLNECDFLETKFKEHDSHTEYVSAMEKARLNSVDVALRFGVIVVFVSNGAFLYEYGPLGMSCDEQMRWLEEKREKRETEENTVWYRNIYWELVTVSCVLVLRNRAWFTAAAPKMLEFWKRVEQYRADPASWSDAKASRKRRQRHIASQSVVESLEGANAETKCYIRIKKPICKANS